MTGNKLKIVHLKEKLIKIYILLKMVNLYTFTKKAVMICISIHSGKYFRDNHMRDHFQCSNLFAIQNIPIIELPKKAFMIFLDKIIALKSFALSLKIRKANENFCTQAVGHLNCLTDCCAQNKTFIILEFRLRCIPWLNSQKHSF